MEVYTLMFAALFVVACSIPLAASREYSTSHNRYDDRQKNNTSHPAGYILPVYHILHPKYRKNDSFLNESAVVALIDHTSQFKYLVEVELGTPLVSVSLVLDTGSSFTWISSSVFNYRESRTYLALTCDDPECRETVGKNCVSGGRCTYSVKYASSFQSSGYVGVERFMFLDNIKRSSSTSIRMVMGNELSNDPGNPGIFGLGVDYNYRSLLRGLKVDRFSICLPLSYPDSSYLRLGNEALLLGAYTHLTLNQFHYYFDVKAVAVANNVIEVPSKVLVGNGGFIFDTGASVTNFHPILMDAVRSAMHDAVGLDGVSDGRGIYDYCYYDRQLTTIQGFRRFQVALQFDDDSWLRLGFSRTWTQVGSDLWCLAFLKSPYDKTIFGSWQMRNINFGLDMYSSRLYFQDNANCGYTDK